MQLLKLFACFEAVHKLFGCYGTYLHLVYTVTLQCLGCGVEPQVIFIWLWIHHEWSLHEVTYIDTRELSEQSDQSFHLTVLRFFLKIIPFFSQFKWFVHSGACHS